ncbi:MAG: hypothetical protein Q9212_005016, partial [Teloschistes hypoglaucus]
PPDPQKHLRIHSVFVFADPRDWALDTQILIDVLRSDNGILGTTAKKSTQKQIPLHFSNPDILYAATHHLPRMGQGAFLASFLGAWNAVTDTTTSLEYKTIGKPSQTTFEFAEHRLRQHLPKTGREAELKKVYMIGDNPASDIQGGNTYVSPFGTACETILVRSGVYTDDDDQTPAYTPTTIKDNVWEAITWALEREGFPTRHPSLSGKGERKGVWAGMEWPPSRMEFEGREVDVSNSRMGERK